MVVHDTVLKIFVECPRMLGKYKHAEEEHNRKVQEYFPDAGFDLFVPGTSFTDNIEIGHLNIIKIDMKVKCAMFFKGKPCSYYLYPRSSITKTPLRLANSVGIIDSGYRGNIMAVFDNVNIPLLIGSHENYEIICGQRLVQICSPTLAPLTVEIVKTIGDLMETERGEGGFGSTGQ